MNNCLYVANIVIYIIFFVKSKTNSPLFPIENIFFFVNYKRKISNFLSQVNIFFFKRFSHQFSKFFIL